GHGGLLQGVPQGRDRPDPDQVQPFRVRAGSDGENREASAEAEDLRGGRGVLRAELRGGEEDHVEGWSEGSPDDSEISVYGLKQPAARETRGSPLRGKSEARNPKSETNPNDRQRNDRNGVAR